MFNPGAKLDPSQVEDVRGSRAGGRGLAAGGSGIAVIVTLVWVPLGGSPTTGGTLGNLVDQTIGGGAGEPGPASSALASQCRTGADANAAEDCRIVGYVHDGRIAGGSWARHWRRTRDCHRARSIWILPVRNPNRSGPRNARHRHATRRCHQEGRLLKGIAAIVGSDVKGSDIKA